MPLLTSIDPSAPANNTAAGLIAQQMRTLKATLQDQFPDIPSDAWDIPLTIGPRGLNGVASKVSQEDFDEVEARVSVTELALLNQATAIVALDARIVTLETAGFITAPEAADAVWPVGSVFISYDGVSPSTKGIAGTWVAFGVGSVLLGSNTTYGTTGGSMSLTLTEANLPPHRHLLVGAGGPLNPTTNPLLSSNQIVKVGDTGGSAAYSLAGSSTDTLTGRSGVGAGTSAVMDTTPAHVKVAFYRRSA